MKARRLSGLVVVVLLLMLAVGSPLVLGALGPARGAQSATPLAAAGTSFIYQGELQDGGGPVNGACDLRFKLWTAASGGSQVGSTVTLQGVGIVDGLFTAQLDFGSNAFQGSGRWLQVGARCPAGSGSYTWLSPRQALTASPYALYARKAPWDGLDGVPPGLGDGDDNTTYTAGTGLALAGNEFRLQSSYRLPQGCGNNQFAKWTGSGWVCSDSESGGGFWSLSGNAGTIAGANYVGTSDNTALVFKVNGARALRLEPASIPNLVGGFSGNQVTAGSVGATIGGGGRSGWEGVQKVTDSWGTIGGGAANQAGDGAGTTEDAAYATVGGGGNNQATDFGATVAGGANHDASGVFSTVAGGSGNTAYGEESTIGGGWVNTASGRASTIGGGRENTASGDSATIAGGGPKSVDDPTPGNLATDNYCTVGGGAENMAGSNNANRADAEFATVGGGNMNVADGRQATVGGGGGNYAGYRATVSGGLRNEASGSYSTVPGGLDNVAAGAYSFAAGRNAHAEEPGSFVWADSTNAPFGGGSSDSFVVRANGGVWLILDSDAQDSLDWWRCYAESGSSWTCTSDRNQKEDLVVADGREVLDRLEDVPIYYWRGIGQETRHLGPMAQDFWAAFEIGDGDTSLSTIDLDGVALAAIQGLHAENEALSSENETLRADMEDLQGRLARLEGLVSTLAQDITAGR